MIIRYIKIIIWIVITGLTSLTTGQSDWRSFVICSDTKDDQTIDCKNGPIYVRSASIVTLRSWRLCDLTNIEPQIQTLPSGCNLEDTGVHGLCHGKRSCTFNRQMTKAALGPGQCANGDETNALYITYSCFDGKDNTATFLPEEGPIVAESFNIFSPFYPCKMPSEEHSFSCTITKNSTRAPSTFALRVEIVRLTFGTSSHCWEHLSLSTTGSKTALLRDYCSGVVREMWRRVLPTSIITSLEISYRPKLNMKNEAGLFWIKVENAQTGQDTKFRISCASTPVNTSSSSIRGCTPFKREVISSGNNDNNNNGNTGQTTVDVTTTTSSVPENTPIVTNSDDSGGISGTAAYAIVAAAIAFIVIIAVVTVFCVCRRTKKDKEYDREDTSTTNIHSVTTGYSSEEEIKNGKITEMKHIGSNKHIKKSKATKKEKVTEIHEVEEDKPKTKESKKEKKTEKKEKESKKEKKEKEPKKEKKDKKAKTVVAAAAIMHASDRDSIRHEEEVEEIQRHSEVVEEPPRTETPLQERPTSYVSNTDSTRELIEHQEDTSVRPESTISEIHRENIQPEELSRTNTPVLAAPVHERPASYVESDRGITSDIEETGSFRPESEIHRESTLPEEVSRTDTPSVLAAPVHGRAPFSIIDSDRGRTSDIVESGSLRPESEINRESVVYEDHSRTSSVVVVPPAPPPPGMQSSNSSRLDDVIDAPQGDDLSSVRGSAAIHDSDIIQPEPGYSSVQAASLELDRREYTPLQQEQNASYTDDINRTSYVPGGNRDSIDYEDTVNVYPHEDEVNREPAYPEEMYAVVDKRKKRQSSAIYQSDDTVDGDVATSAYENVEFTGLKDEESMASGYHNRDSDIMF